MSNELSGKIVTHAHCMHIHHVQFKLREKLTEIHAYAVKIVPKVFVNALEEAWRKFDPTPGLLVLNAIL